MTHLQVKELRELLMALIEHLNPAEGEPCKIFHINYGLQRNLAKINTAIAEIDKTINQELKDLELKAYKLGPDDFAKGFELLDQADKDRHAVLVAEFLKDMEQENDLVLYYLDPDKCDALEIDFKWMGVLAKFIRT